MKKLLKLLFALGVLLFASLAIGGALTGHFEFFLLFVLICGPIAFYRKFINKKTRTVGSRPYVAGRDCPTCGGWGQIDGHICPGICAGRQTR
jgi:hypothetical protein